MNSSSNPTLTTDRQERRDRLAAKLSRTVGSRRLFDYDRSLLVNPVLEEAEDGVGSIQEAMEVSGLTMGYPSWNLLYYTLLCSLPRRPATVIEAGSNRGFSTVVLAQALHDIGNDGIVHTIDIDPEIVPVARDTVARAGLTERVEFHLGDSVDVLRELAAGCPTFDFVMLDGSHEHEQVVREFEIVHPKVGPESLVYFDNTSSEGVALALADIRQRYGGSLVELNNCSWWPPGNALWQRAR